MWPDLVAFLPIYISSCYKIICFFFSHVKVADLEREIQSQKEHRLMYRKRMKRTQDYLRYCLQIAQENGFLHLIINNKDDKQEGVLYSNIVTTSPLPLSQLLCIKIPT